MQVYTKILIGMAVGALIGLTLGPNSNFLEHDLYKVSDAGRIHLATEKAGESSRIALPAGLSLDLTRLKTEEVDKKDSKGKTHRIPAWAEVQFTYDAKLGLRDKDGSIRKALGNPNPGDSVKAWLKLEHTPLNAGGFVVSPIPVSGIGSSIVSFLDPIGELFMRLIKMVIVPLVFSSLLVGVASLGDVRKLGKLGGKTLGTYLMTTALAVTIGLVSAHTIQPGKFIAEGDRAEMLAQFGGAVGDKVDKAAEAPSAIENVLAIIPVNPVESFAQGNMLQIIFFAAIFGVALTLMGASESQIVVQLFDRIQQAMVLIIHMVMAIAPYGVAALIAKVVGMSGLSMLKALMIYAITVLVGLMIHGGLVYGGLVKLFTPLGWKDFMNGARPAQLIAFSTSSSSAALPVTMECAEEKLGVSNSVSSFVLPLGSTVNMDGTALYQGVAAIFIAQVFNIDLTIGAQLGIVLTATMASIGAAGVPGAGMVTLAMVLTSSGIPQVGIALILGVDRLLDMFRTGVNVTGDLAVTAMMAATEGEELRYLPEKEDIEDPDQGFENRLEKEEEVVNPDA